MAGTIAAKWRRAEFTSAGWKRMAFRFGESCIVSDKIVLLPAQLFSPTRTKSASN